MSILSEIRKPVEQEMLLFEKHFKSAMKSKISMLDIITNFILRRKGKQIRPLFVFLTAKTIGNAGASSYHAASLIELLHTATLIHDDVVDDSFERRGFYSINVLWKSKVAVLFGDYLFAKGLLLAVDNNEHELLRIVSEAVKEMSEGELLQIQKSRKLNITQEEYFNIIRKKTATLIAACTACGAKSAGANDDTIAKFKLIGENIGMAFQIKDDLFDYQNKGLIGKPTGNDIKEKKFTLPLIHALENSNRQDRDHIISLISRHNHNATKIREVIEFAIRNQGLEFSEMKMQEYRDKAVELLTEYPDNEAKRSLLRLVDYVISRNK